MKIVITDNQGVEDDPLNTELYVVFDDAYAFPGNMWTDFTGTLLFEWINAFVYSDHKRGFEWRFMDGVNYKIKFSPSADGVFDIICVGNNGKREYYKTKANKEDLKNALITAISDLISVLKNNKIKSDEMIRNLKIKASVLNNCNI